MMREHAIMEETFSVRPVPAVVVVVVVVVVVKTVRQ
jgi:hypothetical protein